MRAGVFTQPEVFVSTRRGDATLAPLNVLMPRHGYQRFGSRAAVARLYRVGYKGLAEREGFVFALFDQVPMIPTDSDYGQCLCGFQAHFEFALLFL